MEFEVVDRRKEKQAAEAAGPAVLVIESPDVPKGLSEAEVFGGEKKKEPKDALKWESVGYTFVYLNINQQQALAIRAVGLRSDEKTFTADWLLPPVIEEQVHMQIEVRKRLDTFKACACRTNAPCAFHVEKCPGRVGPGAWIVEDVERIGKVQSTPLPKSLEILMRAEAARQNSKIVPPGR